MHLLLALKKTFLPVSSNGYRANILKPHFLVILLLLFLVLQRGVVGGTASVLGYASQISPAEVIRLTNIKRAENGLAPVSVNANLNAAAKEKGLDMLAKGYWAHVAPDGTQPWDFFKNVGYKYRYAGENLARDFSSPASAVDAWMASPSHRENMLSDRYKEVGVAVVDGNLNGKDATIIVQFFGSLMAGSPSIPVAATKNAAVALGTQKIESVVLVPTTPPSVNLPVALDVTVTSMSPLDYSKIISFAVVGIIFTALLVDTLVMFIRGTKRTGKPFAQIAFLGMILAIIVVAKAGQII